MFANLLSFKLRGTTRKTLRDEVALVACALGNGINLRIFPIDPQLVESTDTEGMTRRNYEYRELTINYTWISDCREGRYPNPQVVQESTVLHFTMFQLEQSGKPNNNKKTWLAIRIMTVEIPHFGTFSKISPSMTVKDVLKPYSLDFS